MKTKLILFALLFINLVTFGQIKILKDSILKPGVYKNILELKQNKPSSLFNLIVKKDSIKYEKGIQYGQISKDSIMPIFQLDISKKQRSEIGSIIGFCDGKNVYLNPFPPEHPRGIFFKVDILDRVSYFPAAEFLSGQYSNNSIIAIEAVVDFNRNVILELTNHRLKNIIKDNKTLYREFKKEDKKHLKYKEYLLRYLNRE